MLTAAQDAAQRAREIGAAGYLAKPFDLEALLAVVTTHTSAEAGRVSCAGR